MPLKIVTDEKLVGPHGQFITRNTVKKMVQNFIDITHKKEGSSVRKVTHDNDSHAVWYSKEELDTLFAVNGCKPGMEAEFGLRIYFAVHSDSDMERTSMPERPTDYIGHHTAVLVCTKDRKDLLDKDDSVSTYISAAQSGTGFDEGHICPPPDCGTFDGELQP